MRFFKSLDVEKKEHEETMVIKPSKLGVILAIAREHIQHSDEARASYYENISKKSWKNVDKYD